MLRKYTLVCNRVGADVEPNSENQFSSIRSAIDYLERWQLLQSHTSWLLFFTADWDGIYFGPDPAGYGIEIGPMGGTKVTRFP